MVVPLRGRRRALGTLVVEGIESASDRGSKLLDYADELGRQLSSALENVQLLEAIIRSCRELNNTFNSIADLVAVCDRRLCLVHVNRAFASRVGLSCEDALDRPLTQFLGPETGEWISQLDLLSASGSPNPVTREIHDPVLRGTFSMTLTTLFNQDDRPIGGVMVARDITEQARLEAERATLRERLTQSEKLAALGQFVAGIAHELNNPLQGVLGPHRVAQRHRRVATSSAAGAQNGLTGGRTRGQDRPEPPRLRRLAQARPAPAQSERDYFPGPGTPDRSPSGGWHRRASKL